MLACFIFLPGMLLASGAEVEEEAPKLPPSLFIVEIAVVILLSLLFETGQEKLRHFLKHSGKQDMMCMVDTVFKEITVLGFIGLFVYVMTHTGAVTNMAVWLLGKHAEGDALSESFENVHMVIFSVMMVFIFQALVLMVKAHQMAERWSAWENRRAMGDRNSGSIQAELIEHGFLDKDSRMLKKVTFQHNPFIRMLQQGGVRELIQWRAVRHVFLWSQELGDEEESLRGSVIQVKEPQCFFFHEYLTKKVYEIFEDIIEVDKITWIVMLMMLPILHPIMNMEAENRVVAQCFCGWFLVFVTYLFGVQVYWIYGKVTPIIPENPEEILGMLKGTSAVAFKQKSRGLAKSQSQDISAAPEVRPSQDDSGHVRVPLLAQISDSKKPLLARFRKEAREAEGPLKIPWWCRNAASLGNAHERLFPFGKNGVNIMSHCLECGMLLQAVATAGLLVSIVVAKPADWTHRSIFFYCLAFLAPLTQWNVLIPKIVTKFAIVTSVEYMKDRHIIEEVAFEVKRNRIKETLKLMKIVRLQGRAQRLGGETISASEFSNGLNQFKKLPKKKQLEMESTFKVFDSDSSGSIDGSEMQGILATIGIVTVNAEETVGHLLRLVDRDGNQQLNLEEFKVLMVQALLPPGPEQEALEMASFFDKIDSDASGKISMAELARSFREMGCQLDEGEFRDIVYDCFRRPMEDMSKDEFSEWVKSTEERLDEGE